MNKDNSKIKAIKIAKKIKLKRCALNTEKIKYSMW